jgi:hypothetical protein
LASSKFNLYRPQAMSALPPKADIVQHSGNVRFVPKGDIAPYTQIWIERTLAIELPAAHADVPRIATVATVPSAGEQAED